jgi:hypothetical protein
MISPTDYFNNIFAALTKQLKSDLANMQNITGDLYFLNNVEIELKRFLNIIWDEAAFKQLVAALSSNGTTKSFIALLQLLFGIDAEIELIIGSPNSVKVNVVATQLSNNKTFALNEQNAMAIDSLHAFAIANLSQQISNPIALLQGYVPLGVIFELQAVSN